MRITTIVAGFERKRQPQQFESAGAQVTYTAVIDEGDPAGSEENIARAAAILVANAAAVVYNQLGLNVAPKAEPAPVAAATVLPLPKRTRRTKEQIAADEAAKAGNASQTTTAPSSAATQTPAATGAQTAAALPAAEPEPWEVEAAKPATVEPITNNALQQAASQAAGRVGGPAVKALMAEFGVALLSKLTQEQRVEFVKRAGELKKPA